MSQLSLVVSAGLASLIAWDIVVPNAAPNPGDSREAPILVGAEGLPTVNRAAKGDYVALLPPRDGEQVTTFRTMQLPNTTVVHDGRVLTRFERPDARTVAVKRPERASPPQERAQDDVIKPTNSPQQKRTIQKGCDPMFSPVAQPHLSHLIGRCVTDLRRPGVTLAEAAPTS